MKKWLILGLVISCLILGGFVVVIKMTDDSQPPVIQFEDNELLYTEGEDFDGLLEGVTAIDKRDGDVTFSLVVEDVIPNVDGKTASVLYAARDDSNNIANARRTVNYRGNSKAVVETEKDAVEVSEEPTSTPEPTEELVSEEDLPEGSPRITLTTDEVTIERGDSVNRIAFVKNIEDDQDDQDKLWRSIQITGDSFDPNTPGIYRQIYFVIDSDGNRSNEVELTITVE